MKIQFRNINWFLLINMIANKNVRVNKVHFIFIHLMKKICNQSPKGCLFFKSHTCYLQCWGISLSPLGDLISLYPWDHTDFHDSEANTAYYKDSRRRVFNNSQTQHTKGNINTGLERPVFQLYFPTSKCTNIVERKHRS